MSRIEIPTDEILDVFASLVDAEVALAEDVGPEVQHEFQGGAVLAAVREQGRVEGAVDVLSEQHGLSCEDCGVDQRPGRVAGAVVGDHLAAAHRDGFPHCGDVVIDSHRQHPSTIPGGGRDVAVTRFKVNGILFVGCDAATVYFRRVIDKSR